MKSEFSPQAKKNTYRRKIHWRVEVESDMCMCVCVCECVSCVYFVAFLGQLCQLAFAVRLLQISENSFEDFGTKARNRCGNLWWFSTHALAPASHLPLTHTHTHTLSPSLGLPVSFSLSLNINFPDSGIETFTTPSLCWPTTLWALKNVLWPTFNIQQLPARLPACLPVCPSSRRVYLPQVLLLLLPCTYYFWLFGGKAFSGYVCSLDWEYVCLCVCVCLSVCLCVCAPKRFSTSAVADLFVAAAVGIDCCSPVT